MFKKIISLFLSILLLCSAMICEVGATEIQINNGRAACNTSSDIPIKKPSSANVENIEIDTSNNNAIMQPVDNEEIPKEEIQLQGTYVVEWVDCEKGWEKVPEGRFYVYADVNKAYWQNGNNWKSYWDYGGTAYFYTYRYAVLSDGSKCYELIYNSSYYGNNTVGYFHYYSDEITLDWTYHTFGSASSYHPHYKYCDCGESRTTYNSSCYTCNPAEIDYDDYYGGPGSVTVTSSSTTISSTLPTRFKYKFRGWSTSSSSTNGSYDPGDTVYLDPGETLDLYPSWESYQYLYDEYDTGSTYMEINGTLGYFRFSPPSSGTYVFKTTNSSGDPDVYLYNSSGTQLTSDTSGGNAVISYNLSSSSTYYYGVKYYNNTGTVYVEIRKQYNISYNANGGSGAPSTQTKLYGNNLTLSSTIPTRAGYSFVGWNTSSTATTANYSAGGSCGLNADTTLYAIWKAEGSCGDNCSWVLDNAGTLTISGTGDIANYSDASSAPWNSVKDDIKKIVVSEGITSIGDNCFKLCSTATTISLPTTLKSVGENSFAYTPVTTISLPEGVISIGASAFEGCSKLSSVVFPSTLEQIGNSAFINCSVLNNVGIPSGVTTISDYCFAECSALKNITIPLSVTEIKDYAFCMTSVETISYAGSPTHWNKIVIGTENTSLSSATKTYGVKDFTVTYAVTTNGASSADKTSDQVPNGEKADLTVVAKRGHYGWEGPIGTEKDVPWEFLGWNTDQNATVALEELIVTSDITLYPIFKKELTYNFYHANNELLESKTITIYNSDNTAKVTMPSFDSYLDWEPVEWCNDKFYSEMSDPVRMFDINAEVELQFSSDFYARYKRTTSVSYIQGDYSETFEPDTFTQYYYGSGQKTSGTVFMPELSLIPIGEPLFYGWAKNSTSGDVFQSGDRMTVSEETIMYALWQERAISPTINIADDNGLKTVSMSCTMDDASIYYTTDGSKPTKNSNVYSSPIKIVGNEDMTFRAISVCDGYAYSNVTIKNVALNRVPSPVSSILPGFIRKNSTVKLSTDTQDAVIYYTTDGTIPTRESDIYSTPFTITDSIEICTIAVKDGMKDSPITLFKYTVVDETTPYITIRTNINADNNTLTAIVNISENSKSAGGSFNLIYDNSVLEVTNVVKGNYIKSANPQIKKDYNDNTIRVVWASAEELEGGGELIVVTFNMLESNKEQTLLALEKAKLSDANDNRLNVQSSDSIVLLSNNIQYFDKYETETVVGADKKSLIVELVKRANKAGKILTAVYSENGKLVQLKSTDITNTQDIYTITLDSTIESKQEVKVFVWSSLSNLTPISDVEQFVY